MLTGGPVVGHSSSNKIVSISAYASDVPSSTSDRDMEYVGEEEEEEEDWDCDDVSILETM
jgi:hypothetical protein